MVVTVWPVPVVEAHTGRRTWPIIEAIVITVIVRIRVITARIHTHFLGDVIVGQIVHEWLAQGHRAYYAVEFVFSVAAYIDFTKRAEVPVIFPHEILIRKRIW